MSSIDIVNVLSSVLSSIISIAIGIIAIWQARKYKNLSDKSTACIAELLDHRNDLQTDFILSTRTSIKPANTVCLHKDSVIVKTNDKYNPSKISELVEKINEEFPVIIKQIYIDQLCAALNLADSDDITCKLALKSEYKLEDIAKIKQLNDSFNEMGIVLIFQIS